MDKNTLWGLLLMGAIFFGFMYCNKPAPAPSNTSEPTETAAADPAAAVTADSLDAAAEAALMSAVRTLGTAGDDSTYVFESNGLSLRLDQRAGATPLTGSVAASGTSVDIEALRHAPAPGNAATHAAAVAALHDFTAKSLKYGDFARHLAGEESMTYLENEKIRVGISSRGGMVTSVVLKDYNTEVGDTARPIELFRGAADGYGFTFTTSDQRFNTREFNFVPVAEGDTSVMMTLDLGAGTSWGLRYTLHPDSYIVGMEIVQKSIDRVLPASTVAINLDWHQTMARNEKGRTFEERNSAIYYKYVGETPDDLDAHKDDSENLNSRVKWVAFKNQFFSSVLIARDQLNTAELSSVILKNDPTYLKDMSMTASVPYSTTDGVPAAFDFYFGPNDYPLLSSLDDTVADGEDLDLTRLIPLGWSFFRYINTWIVIPVFTFLSSYISNYGIIILLLTIFIKLIIFPFTFKSFKSQARMRLLAPEIKQINDKYPGQENALKRQQETMDLYRRTGASPFSGCLPMLLQMPVLIAMFSFFPSAIELRGEAFLWAKDLSAPDFIITLPFTIPFYGNGVSLFCLLMTVVNIVYMHINMQNQPGGNAMPGMKWMTYLMPVMFLFIFNDYASGLSYYYFLSLLITIVQTWAFRHFMDEDKVRAELLANAKKPRKKSGFMARLEAAQRQQQALQRQQQAAGKRKR